MAGSYGKFRLAQRSAPAGYLEPMMVERPGRSFLILPPPVGSDSTRHWMAGWQEVRREKNSSLLTMAAKLGNRKRSPRRRIAASAALYMVRQNFKIQIAHR